MMSMFCFHADKTFVVHTPASSGFRDSYFSMAQPYFLIEVSL